MMTRTKCQIISEVLRTKRYVAVAVASGIVLGIIYYALTMAMLPMHLEVGIVMEAAPAYLTASVSLTILVSGLAGVNFAMMAYKIKMARMVSNLLVKKPKKSTTTATATPVLGGVFAAFTPGCPACTAPLVVVLGAVGGLSIFPMQGLELKMISVGVLLLSIWWIARGLQANSCCRIS